MARERKHPPRKKRRGRFRLIYKLISLVVVAAAMATACVVFFRINTIQVQGNVHYSAQEIIAVSGIEMGENMVTLWEPSINQSICSQLPYVRQVQLQRRLPDQLTLLVTERTVAATIQGAGSLWLVSEDGYLLESAQQIQGLEVVGLEAVDPQPGSAIQAEEGSQFKVHAIVQLMSALSTDGRLNQCTKLDLSTAGSMVVTYEVHQLKFPLYGDYPYMLQLFQAVLDSQQLPEGEGRMFDFTVAEREVYVQRLKEGT